jgi:hypothetical protein
MPVCWSFGATSTHSARVVLLSILSLQALEGGGAKNINFQELAADLAQITFDYPFRWDVCHIVVTLLFFVLLFGTEQC